MALAPGTRLGPYELGSQIGAGGMGSYLLPPTVELALKIDATGPVHLTRIIRHFDVAPM
jgi:hypothetical protein